MIRESKYQPEVDKLMQELKADGILLVVVNGPRGDGCACTIAADMRMQLARVLESIAVEQRQERREVGQRAVEFVDQAGLDAAIGQHDGRRLQAIDEAGHDSSQRVGGKALAYRPLPWASLQCERSSRCL